MQPDTLPKQTRRFFSFRKTFLLLVIFFLSIFGWLRFAGALQIYGYLLQLGINPHPLYFVLSGATIGIFFLIAIPAVLFSTRWSIRFIRFCGIGVTALLLIEDIFLHSKPNVALAIFILLILILLLILTGTVNKDRQSNEKKLTGN